MKSIKSLIIPAFVCLVAMGTSVGFQHRMIKDFREMNPRFRDTLYIPSSDYVKIISLGYNHFAADFLWLRMIQVFAGAWSSAENPTQIFNYCDKISDLDPRFNEPYSFAIMGISEESRTTAKKADASKQPNDPFGTPYLKVSQIDAYLKQITQKAIEKNPGSWKVPYDGAFFAYWSLNDLQLAKYYIRMAKHDPDYPNYIDRWEGYFDVKAGRHRAAYEKFLGDYINAIGAGNKDLYAINRMQIYRAVNDWFVSEIKQRAEEWQKTHGRYPTIDELRQSGAFKGVELPNMPNVTGFLRKLLADRVNGSLTPEQINELANRSILKWDDLPAGAYDVIDSRFKGFFIWRTKSPSDEKFVQSAIEAAHSIKDCVVDIQTDAANYKKAKGQYPPFSRYAAALTPEDPSGRPWIYDQSKGELKSQTFPNIMEMDLPDVYVRE